MKVEKEKFDAVLTKLIKAKPEPRKKIKTENSGIQGQTERFIFFENGRFVCNDGVQRQNSDTLKNSWRGRKSRPTKDLPDRSNGVTVTL